MMEWHYGFRCEPCHLRAVFRTKGERDTAVQSHVKSKRDDQYDKQHQIDTFREAV